MVLTGTTPLGFPDGVMVPLLGMTIPFCEEPKGAVTVLPFALGTAVPGAVLAAAPTPAPIEPLVLAPTDVPTPALPTAPPTVPPAPLHSATMPTTNIEATTNVFIVASC